MMTVKAHLIAVVATLLAALSLASPVQAQAVTNAALTAPTQATPATPRPLTIPPQYQRQEVALETTEKPGTILIDTAGRFLFVVLPDGKAMRYGIGVAREGFAWTGTHEVSRKAKWPSWVPPPEMLEREPKLPTFMEGGPNNPLGARALYIGSTIYRIHGTAEPWTIGTEVSSGCFRLLNADVIDLYERVRVGAKVVVF